MDFSLAWDSLHTAERIGLAAHSAEQHYFGLVTRGRFGFTVVIHCPSNCCSLTADMVAVSQHSHHMHPAGCTAAADSRYCTVLVANCTALIIAFQ